MALPTNQKIEEFNINGFIIERELFDIEEKNCSINRPPKTVPWMRNRSQEPMGKEVKSGYHYGIILEMRYTGCLPGVTNLWIGWKYS